MMAIRLGQIRPLSTLVTNSSRLFHSSAHTKRGISIGGGGNSGLNIPSSSSSSISSPSNDRTPFSALRAELNNRESVGDEVKVKTSADARMNQIIQESETKSKRSSKPNTSAQPRVQTNQSNQKQPKQSGRTNTTEVKEESWATVSERIRLGQIEEQQKRDQEVKLAESRRNLNFGGEVSKITNGETQRVYQFSNSIESQMFINGTISTLSNSNPSWQGSVILRRSVQGIETVEVRLFEENEILQNIDNLANRFLSNSNQSNSTNKTNLAFRSNSISNANITESAMLNSRSRTRLDKKYKIDDYVPVTIQSEQMPGGVQSETKFDQHIAYSSQGPVGQVLGSNDSDPSSPIENHFPIPSIQESQPRSEYTTSKGTRNGNQS